MLPRTLNVRFLQWEMLIPDGPQNGFSIVEKPESSEWSSLQWKVLGDIKKVFVLICLRDSSFILIKNLKRVDL